MKKIIFVVAVLTTCPAIAQTLPSPSRDVFKCETNGKVVYSDAPCLGAKRLHVEPSRGLNKSSGTERIGADVRREMYNEQMAEALRPLFGETAEQRAKRHRRAALPERSKAQCNQLDKGIPAAEKAEKQTAKEALQPSEEHLLRLRMEYIDLKC